MKASGDSKSSAYRSSDFMIAKKFSTIALSRQFPLRDTLHNVMCCRALTIAEMLALPALIGVKHKSVKAVKSCKSLVKHMVHLLHIRTASYIIRHNLTVEHIPYR